jgi:hypothetical protein
VRLPTTGANAGFALVNCREAKGREKLAGELARKVGAEKLNYGEAKKMLAAAPKASRLGERMAGQDRNPGSSEGGGKAAKAHRMDEGLHGKVSGNQGRKPRKSGRFGPNRAFMHADARR